MLIKHVLQFKALFKLILSPSKIWRNANEFVSIQRGLLIDYDLLFYRRGWNCDKKCLTCYISKKHLGILISCQEIYLDEPERI